MLTAKNLERIIELEEKLRSEYEEKLAARTADIQRLTEDKEQLQTTIDKQLKQITELSERATTNKRTEQVNRELTQRCENLSGTITKHKAQAKALQKDLAAERAELKALKQFDPVRMKKNLDANKKKLAEKTSANDLLQSALNKSKTERAELQRKVKELEEKLEQLDSSDNAEQEAA